MRSSSRALWSNIELYSIRQMFNQLFQTHKATGVEIASKLHIGLLIASLDLLTMS